MSSQPTTENRVYVPLDRSGAPRGDFTWQIVEERTGQEWDVTGTFRAGTPGVEILTLAVDPQSGQAPSPITRSTLKELKLSTLRARIAAELDRFLQIARIQVDGVAQTDPTDNWKEKEKTKFLRAWTNVVAGLKTQADLAGRKSGGRPLATPEQWAKRAEGTLEAIANPEQRLYEVLMDRYSAAEETVHSWLYRMRKPLEESDPATGWLIGTRTGTTPGPRLLAWRNLSL